MNTILLFGGTTEGRLLTEYLSDTNVTVDVCVATEYGKELLQQKQNITVHFGRMDLKQMKTFLSQKQYCCVIDATHPYALEVTQNVMHACEYHNIPYYRILRENNNTEYGIYMENIEQAIDYLKNTEGNILLTTGSKEIHKFTALPNFSERVYARVLPCIDSITICQNSGLTAKHIICMQGPFSKDMNVEHIKHTNAKYIVTKQSGYAGGFQQKIDATIQCHATAIILARKEKQQGISYNDCIQLLQKQYGIYKKRYVTLLGIGAGKNTLTQQAQQILQQCDCIIGAKRMIETLQYFHKHSYISYKSEEIAEFIKQNVMYNNIVVAYSGDIGFYSGAKKLYDAIGNIDNITIQTVSGVSSVSYFMSKIQTSWEYAVLISIHGQNQNVTAYVLQYQKVIVLLGESHQTANICKKLCNMGLQNVKIVIGENLSYDTEKISQGTAETFQNIVTSPLSILYIENNNVLQKKCNIGIKDEYFIRDSVPMTKREIRTIVLSDMDFKQNSIVWDVGAGTGSISIESALQCPFGTVYAIEKKQKAIQLLEQNKNKFHIYNMEIICGQAPEILQTLPPPDSVFIGGSSGTAKQIMNIAIQKNNAVKIVATAVTLESIREFEQCFSSLDMIWECKQISVSKSEALQNYHIMKSQNSVWIFCGRRKN